MTPFEVFRKPFQIRRFTQGFYLNGMWKQGSQFTLSGNFNVGNVFAMSLNGIPVGPFFYVGNQAATIAQIQSALASQPNIAEVILSADQLTFTIVPILPNLSVIGSVSISGVMAPTATIINSPTLINITASLQPTTGEEMLSIPEGRRNRKTYSLFTSTKINLIVNGENPDQIVIFNEVYEIFQVEPWQNVIPPFGIINHFKFYAQSIEAIS